MLAMPVGELRDVEGNLFHPGIDGMSTIEYRHWKVLYLRRSEESRKKG